MASGGAAAEIGFRDSELGFGAQGLRRSNVEKMLSQEGEPEESRVGG